MPSHILLGTCLELIGANLAIDKVTNLPFYNNGYDCSMGCTLSHMGGPVEFSEGHCYLPLSLDDPYYSEYLDVWCQDVTITNLNGPVDTRSPCEGDPGVVAVTAAPYGIRAYWADRACAELERSFGWCEVENVCTAADKLAGDCFCTPQDELDALCSCNVDGVCTATP